MVTSPCSAHSVSVGPEKGEENGPLPSNFYPLTHILCILFALVNGAAGGEKKAEMQVPGSFGIIGIFRHLIHTRMD